MNYDEYMSGVGYGYALAKSAEKCVSIDTNANRWLRRQLWTYTCNCSIIHIAIRVVERAIEKDKMEIKDGK